MVKGGTIRGLVVPPPDGGGGVRGALGNMSEREKIFRDGTTKNFSRAPRRLALPSVG